MTPIDFWRNWWSSWFSLCQHQFALQEQIMSALVPGAMSIASSGSPLCGVAPTPASRRARTA
ncbi:hypothetical protein L0V05_06510 [Tabrizicola sp. J26]|uniref:hypothetical protein n=1 Tax=Alitabrizicola rongguiensis TaxID=2909234 RepID=UPI001F1E7F6E|nr:hypothetical protein [Tabrizicola rongguiensis]MCF1708465.1 hypothetical protein [Tabrizicola rongguiensis]